MRNTRTLIFILAILVSVAVPLRVTAQERPAAGQADYGLPEARHDFRTMNLSQEEMAAIRDLLSKDSRDVELARAEIREAQARVARLMLEAKPNLGEIQKSVRDSLEAEFRVRMAQIERNLGMRKLLDDQRWAALGRLSRAFAFLAKSGNLRDLAERTGDAEKLAPLFEILKALQ